jgi:hypothetical protein
MRLATELLHDEDDSDHLFLFLAGSSGYPAVMRSWPNMASGCDFRSLLVQQSTKRPKVIEYETATLQVTTQFLQVVEDQL